MTSNYAIFSIFGSIISVFGSIFSAFSSFSYADLPYDAGTGEGELGCRSMAALVHADACQSSNKPLRAPFRARVSLRTVVRLRSEN